MKTCVMAVALLLCAPAYAGEQKLPVTDVVFPDGFRVRAELAVTGTEQELGLQFRTELAKDAGMLFVGGSETRRIFWMLNTVIALDMVFIGDDHAVTRVHENVPAADLSVSVQNPARRAGLARYVLEVPAGTAKAHGLKKGDKLKFDLSALNSTKPDTAAK
ncbi:MAG: DUF192 domain-containing protein [Elusimicrobiaceae bacterium]|nr:DUF192 domain-containing protein [Elusimicrobiaceae bacterium]